MLFISYAREDRRLAAKLADELAAEGVDCLIDPELAEGDPFWRERIAQRFPDCSLMVGIASTHARNSPWVEQEQRAFPGRRLWVAADDAVDRLPPQADGPNRLIGCSRAVRAILAALPPEEGSWQAWRSRRKPVEDRIGCDERDRRIRDAQRRLDALLRSRDFPSRLALEVAGDVACGRNAAIELRFGAADRETSGSRVFVGTTPVTNTQYRAFIDATGFAEPPTWQRPAFRADDAPVTGVNWFEACAFAVWAGGSLPTEADWLAAARGGNRGADGKVRCFATATGEIDPAAACYARAFGASPPAVTATYRPSPEGYFGLCGNTWDWCASPWGTHRVIRGGGCMDAEAFCMIAARYRNAPIDRDCSVGFRVKIALSDTN